MKSAFRFAVTRLLAHQARKELKRQRAQVIGITGSIGKTSTKEAVHHLLSRHFKTYHSPKGFNTEIGLSLAILQEEASGFSSPRAWAGILKRVFVKPKKNYEKIVLEMGADRPGDIGRLIKIAKPSIGVVTAVSPVHLEVGQFRDLEEIRHEKGTLVRHLGKGDLAILNLDDPRVRSMETQATVIGYGTGEDALVRASEIAATAKGVRFMVRYGTQKAVFEVPVLGHFQIYVLLPAIAVGVALGLNLEQCAEAFRDFKLPKGRMNPIEGVRQSQIIDSSYNASPVSAAKALELLSELPAGRKIAALGTMNELGEKTREAHLALGSQASQSAQVLVAVGPEAATIKEGAIKAGMPETSVYTFLDSEEAGAFLADVLQEGDLVLAKGSQNRVRMEKLVKKIMAHPEQAADLLCRQDEAWDKIG